MLRGAGCQQASSVYSSEAWGTIAQTEAQSGRLVIASLVCAPAKAEIACPWFELPGEPVHVAGQP